MTLQRFTTLSLTATLILCASACDLGEKSIGDDADAGDGDGDNGDGDGDEQPAFGDCGEETVSIIDDPEVALPGFGSVASEYIAMAEGDFLGDFGWLPNDGFVTVAHAGTSSALTMSVSYGGGEIRLTEVAGVGGFPDDNLGGFVCSNILEIDLDISFATADGLFNEVYTVPARVLSHDDVSLPSLYFSLDMTAHQGLLSLADFSVSDGEVSDLVMIGQFDGDGVDGSLNIEILTMEWVGFGGVANWSAVRE